MAERIGRVSVSVEPDFDQAELFRQIRAASKKIPALNLKVKILAKDANEAIRELNKKKLISLNLTVKIKVTDVNKAIREVNGKRLVAITPPVKLHVREVNKAIREVNRRRLTAITTELKIKEVIKTTKDLDRFTRSAGHAKRGISQFAANIVVLRSAFGLVRIDTIATAIGFIAQAAASATAAITALTASLSPGLIGGLTSAAVGATAFAQGLGVIKLSLAGVKDALGGIHGLTKDLDPKKLAALTPAARNFVLEIQKIKPEIRGLQQSLQQELFAGLLKSFTVISPLIRKLSGPLQLTAHIMGELALSASKVAAVMSGDLNRILSTNTILIRNAGNTVIDLSRAFIELLVAAGPLTVFLSNSSRHFAVLVRNFIHAKRESGDLAKFFQLAADSLSDFGRIAKGLTFAIVNIFRAALPSGSTLLNTLADITEHLGKITGSKENQKSIRKFFESALPAITAAGVLIRDIGAAFLELASHPGLKLLIEALDRQLLPKLTELIDKITKEFGPVLVVTLTELAILFSTLAGEGGPMNLLVETVGQLAFAINFLITQEPGILKIAAALFVVEAALSVIAIQKYIFAASGLGRVVSVLKIALIGPGGFAAAVTASGGGIGGLALTLARLIPVLGLVVAGITVATISFDQFFQNLKNGDDIGIAFAKSFSFAILTTVKITLQAIKKISDAIANLPSIPGVDIVDTGAEASSAAIGILIEQIDDLNKITKAIKPPKVFGPELTPQIQAQIDLGRATKQSNKAVKDAQKEWKKYSDVGVASADALKAAADPAAAAAKSMKDSLQGSVDTMRDRLDKLSGTLERQKTLVDNLKSSLEELKNVQLAGTKAFSDAKFALDQQSKALELQQLDLKLAGVSAEDPAFKALGDQIENLGLQAQKVDLTESLQLDPLRRKFDETVNPIKELSFDSAISQFQKLSAQSEVETGRLTKLQGKYDGLNDAIQKVEKTISRLSDSTSSLSSGLAAAVSTPQVIQKPLEKANESLAASKEKIQNNIGSIREGLRKPFRLAAQDITRILAGLPHRAAPAAATSINWFFAIGETMGMRLIAGLMTGMRSALVEGSPLHKLLNEEIPAFIRANKGPIAADQQILVPAGVAIMQGLTTGLKRGFEPVKGYLKDVGPSMQEYVPDSMFSKRTAEFMVEVAAGKKPNPAKFFGDLVPSFPPIDFEAGGISGANPFHAIEGLLGLQRSSGDHDAPGVHAAGSYHYRPAPWGGVQAYDYGDALNSVSTLLKLASFAKRHASLFAEAFFDKFGSYVKDGKVINGMFGGHGDHVHLAFRTAIAEALGSAPGGPKTRFDGIIQAASAAYKVNASLIKAVVQAESNFDPHAGSGAGAQGLMQLLPGTFASQHVGGNIFDPRQNVFAGTKYLSSQLKRFKSTRLALAAYNAGPGNVERFNGVPPFAETIAYVERVLRFMRQFGGFRQLGGPVMPGKSFMVGEAGPEMFMPRRAGHIVSNERLDRMIKAMEQSNQQPRTLAPTYNVQTASQDPRVVTQLLDARERRRRARMDL